MVTKKNIYKAVLNDEIGLKRALLLKLLMSIIIVRGILYQKADSD